MGVAPNSREVELLELRGGGVGQLLSPVASVYAEKTREPVELAVALASGLEIFGANIAVPPRS